jgi:hypothetical protein
MAVVVTELSWQMTNIYQDEVQDIGMGITSKERAIVELFSFIFVNILHADTIHAD